MEAYSDALEEVTFSYRIALSAVAGFLPESSRCRYCARSMSRHQVKAWPINLQEVL